MGFEPMTSPIPVQHSTARTGLNFFFRPYFYYYLSSVHNCEGRLHIRFFSRSSHI